MSGRVMGGISDTEEVGSATKKKKKKVFSRDRSDQVETGNNVSQTN